MSRFVTIDFSQLSPIVSDLQAIGKRASDLRPAALTVALVIQSYTDQVFDSAPNTQTGGTVFNGESWNKLKESTLKANNGRRRNGKILRDKGALLNSLQVNGAGNFFDSGSNFIEFGSNLPQAFNNDLFPFLVPTDQLTDDVAAALENYILTGDT